MNAFNIRLAKDSDIPAILELVKAVVPEMRKVGNFQWDEKYPNLEVFERDIEVGNLWVAEIEGDVVGISAITCDQEPEYAQVGWDINEMAIVTHRLAVDPKHQGKGIAIGLLNQAETVALDKGIGILRVDTNVKNIATQKLFPKLGYLYAGEINLSFRPGLSFYAYEKRISLR